MTTRWTGRNRQQEVRKIMIAKSLSLRRIPLMCILAFGAPVCLVSLGDTKVPVSAAVAPAAATSQPAKTKEQKKAEDTARVMEFFRVTQPDVYEQAKCLRDNDSAAFDKMIHASLNTVNKLEELRKRNYPLFELRMKDFELAYRTIKLAKEIKRPDIAAADKDHYKSQLTDLVSAQFDLRQHIRQLEIEDIQKQLADLGQQLEDRKADKDTIIKKRVDDLIETFPRLEW